MKLALSFILLLACLLIVAAKNVTYDGQSLIINGTRRLIISAAIQYPRSTPEMWPEVIRLAKEGGANTIDTYVFWNVHEVEPDVYNFAGRFDLVRFVKLVQDAGLYLILRIGPFIGAEWNYGGVPVWLHYIPGTAFRTESASFKYYMEKFVTYIVNLMKREKFFASQGENGPIILAQIENEYEHLQVLDGVGHNYSDWAARMAVSKDIGVPWIMCREGDALDPVIDTINDFYADNFHPNSKNKPKIWTEAWTGWIRTNFEPVFHRPTQDLAFAAARFLQKGGSVINYYMFYGGTNFGRTGGGTGDDNYGVITSYDYDAPIDEYGLLRYPNYGHLKEFNEAIKLCENLMLTAEPTQISLGRQQEGVVWNDVGLGECAAFLVNVDNKTDATVVFQNVSYHLPAWSVSILPDCKNVVFNTAKVSSQTSVAEMVPEDLKPSPEQCMEEQAAGDDSSLSLKWQVFEEKVGIWGEPDYVKNGFMDQVAATRDTTDYLWYSTSIDVNDTEGFLRDGSQVALVLQFQTHYLHAFVNGEFKGSSTGGDARMPIVLKPGRNDISILNTLLGLPSIGPFYEWRRGGPINVKLAGFKNGTVIDLSTSTWNHKIGLEGEHLEIYKPEVTKNGTWKVPPEVPKMKPLTWYKATVEDPSGKDPIGLDMLSMGKGSAWLNGQQIGRYWLKRSNKVGNCVDHVEECDYRGHYKVEKCTTGCGEPAQRWYHIPRSWFKPGGNALVVFEEKGGDPTQLKFSKRKISIVCASVTEDYPNLQGNATVHLKCPEKMYVSRVRFASFGTPTGFCGSFKKGDYHHPVSVSVVEKACLQKNGCVIQVSEESFNKGMLTSATSVTMRLAVEATCSSGKGN